MKNTIYILYSVIIACVLLIGCSANADNLNADVLTSVQPSVATETTQSPRTEEPREGGVPKAVSDAPGEESPQSDTVEENSGPTGDKASPSKNGKLSVSGAALIDERGNEVQLKGISTHGLAWFPEYVNPECFTQLKEDFGANAVRLAMYTAESGGYCTDGDKEQLKQLVKDGVNYAKEADMYAIIDWHTLSDNDPNTFAEEAARFFDEMSKEFADYNNVIYEICNEPNNGVEWESIKSYAEKIIPVIRANDPDSVILTGTPNWCQYIDEAAADPLDFENVMYTLHYYAATHKEDLREKVRKAYESGLPVFISEYGICDASGNGSIDYEQAKLWADLADELNISSIMWNLSNKDETSAIISSECDKTDGFKGEDLSAAGKWLLSMLKGELQTAEDDEKEISNDVQADAVSGGGDAVKFRADMVNSWEENGKTVTQYQLNIENTGAKTESWSVALIFDGDFAFKDGWNGNFKASGDTLTVENAEYNGSLKNGAALSDVGFIIAGDGKIVNAE